MDGGVAAAMAQAVGPAGGAAQPAALTFQPWLAVALALAVVFAVQLVRALPWNDAAKRRKPLGCDACMAGWGTLGVAVAVYAQMVRNVPFVVIHALTAAGLSVLLLGVLGYLRAQHPVSLTPPDDT